MGKQERCKRSAFKHKRPSETCEHISSLVRNVAKAPHSSTLAWKTPWAEEPGGLPSMGSLGVGHGWATSLSLFTLMHWRRKWQPTPVFLPGESQGRGSLAGCRLRGRTELDTTDATQQQQQPPAGGAVAARRLLCVCPLTPVRRRGASTVYSF